MPSISPEIWPLFPIKPVFGAQIDPFGGKNSPLTENKFEPFHVMTDTCRGYVDMRYRDGLFNVLAANLGIALLYNKEGILETVCIDVMQYCENMDEDDFEKMNIDCLVEMLTTMEARGDRLYLDIELNNKIVALANSDTNANDEVLGVIGNVDFSLQYLAVITYHDFILYVALNSKDDEFHFGINAGYKGEELDLKAKITKTTILSDCNYKTFLENKKEDRYDKLAKRIFID